MTLCDFPMVGKYERVACAYAYGGKCLPVVQQLATAQRWVGGGRPIMNASAEDRHDSLLRLWFRQSREPNDRGRPEAR